MIPVDNTESPFAKKINQARAEQLAGTSVENNTKNIIEQKENITPTYSTQKVEPIEPIEPIEPADSNEDEDLFVDYEDVSAYESKFETEAKLEEEIAEEDFTNLGEDSEEYEAND